jgi:hypothetical protein
MLSTGGADLGALCIAVREWYRSSWLLSSAGRGHLAMSMGGTQRADGADERGQMRGRRLVGGGFCWLGRLPE